MNRRGIESFSASSDRWSKLRYTTCPIIEWSVHWRWQLRFCASSGAMLVREGSVQFRLGLEPDGIKRCGGDDFDEALYNYCDKLAQEKLGRPISLTGMRDLHFLYECRKRKEILTSHKRRTFSSYLAPESRQFKYELDQTTFEDLIRSQVKK